MTTAPVYLTTTIPYVNARPHLGHALEFVQADVLARHYRRLGHPVRFQTGTDDNSLKNVIAARDAGVSIQAFVNANAEAFAGLAGPLSLSVDDVIRTSSDPRHRAGVEQLWRACSNDLYRKHYEGLYCVGCEAFYTQAELDGGLCPEHRSRPELVAEENWFFRLSRHAARLHDEISSGRLRIEPSGRRNEVLAFIEGGLEDFSVSRSVGRAHGWGIPVPGDPGQVIYVWWDALGNYITALGYGRDEAGLRQWWTGAGRRVHVLGKGVLRFHAVYWPAILASAGLPLPSDILVHDYLTVEGRKISKSGGSAVDPADIAAAYGTDALRWWLLREVPRVGDVDFTRERLIGRANDELAHGIGNLVNRVVSLVRKYRDGVVPECSELPPGSQELVDASQRVLAQADAALAVGDFRQATSAAWSIAVAANRFISQSRPWLLAPAAVAGDKQANRHLDAILALLVRSCRELASQLEPFLPDASARIAAQVSPARLPAPEPVFARIEPVLTEVAAR
ncbi:MAG TPA: methionine--tRNA ligase [Streptosporangiaceae bacterium]|jgi:methionyl-tRNA synthetase|nr:methionine--tRNA ligase [Streptosporangiaceae bacterium]